MAGEKNKLINLELSGGNIVFKNRLKQKIVAGEPAFGIFNLINTPEVIEIMGLSGFDFVVIDGEHGPAGPLDCQDLIRAAELHGMTPVVRATENSPTTILRFLDVGAHGIQVPQVNSPEEADSVVRSSKYFPEGNRGIALPRAADYGAVPPLDYFSRANSETLVVAQCESVEGLDRVEEIAQVEGVDVIFLGPFDMSQSMGIPGQLNDERVENAAERILKACRNNGKAAGIFVVDGESARRRAEQGFQYITINLESSLFYGALSSEVSLAKG